MSAIGKVIQRLFSQKIIIKKTPGDRLRVIDYDKLQSIGNNITPKYGGIKSSRFGDSQYGTGYSSQTEQVDAARMAMYLDYESMESDPILASALDIYADEATVKDAHGNLLTIRCDDAEKKKILNNLYYDILNVDFNLWHWTRSLCKYGDLFLYLNTVPSVGIVDAVPIHPSLIKRDDYAGDNQNLTQYIYEGETMFNYQKARSVFDYHEIAHFRVLTDTNFLPYGKSLLEGARKVWKQLTMMEDAMLIHRIMRAPERRIFKIDVGNLPPEAIDGYMEDVANTMKKVPYIDPQTGDYNLRFNLMNMLEDFYLPTRGADSGTGIESLPGLTNEGSLEDIEYLQKKQMAYLKIPKAYLGYDEGVDGKGTLAAEDIKFARFIERIQKIVVSELQKIGHIHLYMQGFRDEDLVDFSLELSTPSLLYERQKVDLLNEKLNLIQNIKENKLFSRKWVYENLFNMTHEEWEEQQELMIEDLKREFREEQIKSEGNDPAKTGRSFGTPHDIVSMQIASSMGIKHAEESEAGDRITKLYKKDKREENTGRPLKHGSFERDKDPLYGRDPSGRKEFANGFLNAGKDLELIAKSFGKKVVALNEAKKSDSDIDNIKMLDENSLLDELV